MKNNKNLIILAVLVITSIIAYSWFTRQPAFQDFMNWAEVNFWTYFAILVVLKIIAVVYPPIPGGIFTIGSIPVIGPLNAFFADMLGSTIGSIIAYHLGKKYGYALLDYLFDPDVVTKIKTVKINKKHEIEAVFLIRAMTFGISEAVSYGAGLLGIKMHNFLIASIASNIIVLPYFFLWQNVISFNLRNVIYNLIIMLPTAYIFYRFKGRYFE
jgi:uncharacterized membrane protein YdjX (TVP38/TMEM64 family)